MGFEWKLSDKREGCPECGERIEPLPPPPPPHKPSFELLGPVPSTGDFPIKIFGIVLAFVVGMFAAIFLGLIF